MLNKSHSLKKLNSLEFSEKEEEIRCEMFKIIDDRDFQSM